MSLTIHQRRVLAALAQHILTQGLPPSITELARACGFSAPSAVIDHYYRLSRKGLIIWEQGKSRAVVITRAGWAALNTEPPEGYLPPTIPLPGIIAHPVVLYLDPRRDTSLPDLDPPEADPVDLDALSREEWTVTPPSPEDRP